MARKRWKKRLLFFLMALILLPVLLLGWARYIEPHLLLVSHLKADTGQTGAQCRVVFFSDTHFSSSYGKEEAAALAQKINQLKPDIVLFGGDFLDSYARDQQTLELDAICEALDSINAPGGKFAVWGNHDYGGGASRVYPELMEQCGFTLLKNEYITLEDYSVTIIGCDDVMLGSRTMQQLPEDGNFHLVLAHEPASLGLLDGSAEGIMLTGHTHGGQIYLPFLTEQVLPPGSDGYIRGLYAQEETQLLSNGLYVSRGIGTTHLPLRLFNPPEIVELGLSPT